MKYPRVEKLSDAGYVEEERWAINEVLGFVRRELDGKGGIAKLIILILGLGLLLTITYAIYEVMQGDNWLYDIFLPFGMGCLAMIVLIVPHELLHGLAYKITGAPKVKYGANFAQLVFHASAPYHVIGRRQMHFVALLPFAVLTLLLVIALFASDGRLWWAILGSLIMHTQGCLGDFAMVNFWERQDDPEAWVTYDASDEHEFVLLRKDTARL